MPKRHEARQGPFNHIGTQEIAVGSDYTAEELTFIAACSLYRRTTGRKFMSSRDFLIVAKGIGYAIRDVPDPIESAELERVAKEIADTAHTTNAGHSRP